MASGLQGGCGGSEQHSKKANHQAERISGTGAKTAIYRPDEKTTGTGGGWYSTGKRTLEPRSAKRPDARGPL